MGLMRRTLVPSQRPAGPVIASAHPKRANRPLPLKAPPATLNAMTTTTIGPTRPTQRIPHWFLRVPELVFTLHLSRLTPWLTMIVTTGRRTGKPRRVVLDVAKREAGGLWVLAADGLGARWVKNLLADPRCQVTNRGRRFAAHATVTAADPADLVAEVYRDRPLYTRLIYLAVGERVHNEADARRLAEGVVPVWLEEDRTA